MLIDITVSQFHTAAVFSIVCFCIALSVSFLSIEKLLDAQSPHAIGNINSFLFNIFHSSNDFNKCHRFRHVIIYFDSFHYVVWFRCILTAFRFTYSNQLSSFKAECDTILLIRLIDDVISLCYLPINIISMSRSVLSELRYGCTQTEKKIEHCRSSNA